MEADGPGPENIPINMERLRKGLKGTLFSGRVEYHETIDSTNTRAKALAEEGAVEGTVVVTEQQSRGRGRMTRRWLSPDRTNLLFSVLLRPGCDTEKVFAHTMLLALAALESLEDGWGVRAMIKWPNDLYVEERKLGGILSEFALAASRIDYIILGLGLNVNWNPGPDGALPYPTTSVMAETGEGISRTDLLVHILERLDRMYRHFRSAGASPFLEQWNARSMVLGRRVQVSGRRETRTGTALRIDPDGALVLLNDRGEEKRIVSGDVSLRF